MGRRGKTTIRCKLIINGVQKTFNNRSENENTVRGLKLQASRWIDEIAKNDRVNGSIAVNYGIKNSNWDDNEAKFETAGEGKEWVREFLDQKLVDYLKN